VLQTAAFTSAALVGTAYAVGALPLSWLVARRRGIDLRQAGSGNMGATNVLRTAGASAGALALMLDVAKGVVAVATAQWFAASPAVVMLAGVAAVAGHIYPVGSGFRGGKGVATAAGVFLVLAPGALAVAAAVFGIAVAATRFVSFGSTLAAVALVVAVASLDASPSLLAGAVASAALVLGRHRGNLTRLLAGTERRVSFRAAH
jgi:glycerol-3-phosphate acyltransferase PlsY